MDGGASVADLNSFAPGRRLLGCRFAEMAEVSGGERDRDGGSKWDRFTTSQRLG